MVDGVLLQDLDINFGLTTNLHFRFLRREQPRQVVQRDDGGQPGPDLQHSSLACQLPQPEVTDELDVLFPVFKTEINVHSVLHQVAEVTPQRGVGEPRELIFFKELVEFGFALKAPNFPVTNDINLVFAASESTIKCNQIVTRHFGMF